MKPVRLVLAGLGNVGQAFLKILEKAPPHMPLQLVGVADSSGVWTAAEGLSPIEVLTLKTSGHRFSKGSLLSCAPDIYIDATPTSFDDASTSLPLIDALKQGVACVMASKGPLLQAWPTLRRFSDFQAPNLPPLRFGAAIGSALPSYNIARREFEGARIHRMEGILNITCQRMLGLLYQGDSFEDAWTKLQHLGMGEKQPSFDFEGIDAAAKIVILSNALWATQATLADVSRQGITHLTTEALQHARAEGKPFSLVATATFHEHQVELSVKPVALEDSHPLRRVGSTEQGIVFYSDLHGPLTLIGESLGPRGAAAALFRDVLEVTRLMGT